MHTLLGSLARPDRSPTSIERVFNVTLDWRTSDPKANPFEATVGDLTTYRVHFAESNASQVSEIERAVADVVAKSLTFTQANSGGRAKRLLFLWDVVYATLTVVYTDDSMMYDAHHVTKCYFAEVDKAEIGEEPSGSIRGVLDREVSRQRGQSLPPTIAAYFSDEDRASVGAADFTAHQLAGLGT
jgi:hypothetical protein